MTIKQVLNNVPRGTGATTPAYRRPHYSAHPTARIMTNIPLPAKAPQIQEFNNVAPGQGATRGAGTIGLPAPHAPTQAQAIGKSHRVSIA